MPYHVCKRIEIESGHLLSKHPGDCRFPHGHSRWVEIVVASDGLDDHDMVCDFAVVKQTFGAFVNRFDHALCVNTEDPRYESLRRDYGEKIIPFERTDPTTEVMARCIFDHVKTALRAHMASGRSPRLGAGVRLARVRVWETSTSWAEYAETDV